jgi:hypothetical protein
VPVVPVSPVPVPVVPVSPVPVSTASGSTPCFRISALMSSIVCRFLARRSSSAPFGSTALQALSASPYLPWK